MPADHAAVGVANEALEAFLGLAGVAIEPGEKHGRIINLPADIHHDEEVVAVGGQHLLELAFEVVNALVELVDRLDGPRPAEVGAGSGLAADTAEGGDYGQLRLAHLKEEQEQTKDEQQQRADGDGDGIAFHALWKKGKETINGHQ